MSAPTRVGSTVPRPAFPSSSPPPRSSRCQRARSRGDDPAVWLLPTVALPCFVSLQARSPTPLPAVMAPAAAFVAAAPAFLGRRRHDLGAAATGAPPRWAAAGSGGRGVTAARRPPSLRMAGAAAASSTPPPPPSDAYTPTPAPAPSPPAALSPAAAARRATRAAALRTARSLDAAAAADTPAFGAAVAAAGLPPLARAGASTLQVNIGLTCNLACRHCHVESSPSRAETMLSTVAARVVALATAPGSPVRTVDITGGAPELHAAFRPLVTALTAAGVRVMDRCNLTVMEVEGQADLADFLADHRVDVVASLPCYTADNVEAQRGDGVFDASIRALQRLNARGYGRPGGCRLDLVYNPGGAVLPPPQGSLEDDYRRELRRAFGIEFNSLVAITNMPIKRFADDLRREGRLSDYLSMLAGAFNADTVERVMCRDMVHVAWDGRVYDCDFNYALEMGLGLPGGGEGTNGGVAPGGGGTGLTIFDIDCVSELVGKRIRTGLHCFGCTAGSGSSCGGELL